LPFEFEGLDQTIEECLDNVIGQSSMFGSAHEIRKIKYAEYIITIRQ
jgi:hypothetical protein